MGSSGCSPERRRGTARRVVARHVRGHAEATEASCSNRRPFSVNAEQRRRGLAAKTTATPASGKRDALRWRWGAGADDSSARLSWLQLM
jgi:hypothetical protein